MLCRRLQLKSVPDAVNDLAGFGDAIVAIEDRPYVSSFWIVSMT